jgi:hypothetical protein
VTAYLLFGGEDYYPRGGWADFIESFETLELACEHARRLGTDYDQWYYSRQPNAAPIALDWWHIIHAGKVVRSASATRPIPRIPADVGTPAYVEWEETDGPGWWERESDRVGS